MVWICFHPLFSSWLLLWQQPDAYCKSACVLCVCECINWVILPPLYLGFNKQRKQDIKKYIDTVVKLCVNLLKPKLGCLFLLALFQGKLQFYNELCIVYCFEQTLRAGDNECVQNIPQPLWDFVSLATASNGAVAMIVLYWHRWVYIGIY